MAPEIIDEVVVEVLAEEMCWLFVSQGSESLVSDLTTSMNIPCMWCQRWCGVDSFLGSAEVVNRSRD